MIVGLGAYQLPSVCVCVCWVGWVTKAVPVRVGMGVFCGDVCVYRCVCVLWCIMRAYVRRGGYVVIGSVCGGVCGWACCCRTLGFPGYCLAFGVGCRCVCVMCAC